jgi:hypothetical protein
MFASNSRYYNAPVYSFERADGKGRRSSAITAARKARGLI